MFHGAAVDVNGDGRKDLVLSVQTGTQGGLSLLLSDPTRHVSGVGLRRIY